MVPQLCTVSRTWWMGVDRLAEACGVSPPPKRERKMLPRVYSMANVNSTAAAAMAFAQGYSGHYDDASTIRGRIQCKVHPAAQQLAAFVKTPLLHVMCTSR